jgi:hypothetical protein
MVQFATAEELGSFLGRRFDPQERGAAELHLRTASAVIQAAAAQVFELVLDDEIDLRYQRGPDLHLPERPVLAVSAVTVDGAAVTDYIVTGSAVSWIGSGLVGVRGFSPELFGVRSWTPAIKVTYSHGYAIDALPEPNPLGARMLPEEIKTVCLALAARSMTNPTAAAAETMGGYAVTHGAVSALELLPAEERILQRYRQTIFS